MTHSAQQQNCCCPKWHPCCVSYETKRDCLEGSVRDCEVSFPGLAVPYIYRKEFIARECYQSAEDCKQAYSFYLNVEASLYTDYLCDDWDDTVSNPRFTLEEQAALPNTFCNTLPKGVFCPDYKCEPCGPVVDGCYLHPTEDPQYQCPEPPTNCEIAECCGPPPPGFCCCVTYTNGNIVSSTCTELTSGEACSPPGGGLITANQTSDEGGIAAGPTSVPCGECPIPPPDCTPSDAGCKEWFGVRIYKTCTEGRCQQCPNPNCPAAQAQCCSTWVLQLSNETRCVGSYLTNCDAGPANHIPCVCRDGLNIDPCNIPENDLFNQSEEWANRCSEARTFWIFKNPQCPFTPNQIIKSDCGADASPPLSQLQTAFPCLVSIQATNCQAGTNIIASPAAPGKENVYCQTQSVPPDPTAPPGTPPALPPNWYTTTWGGCQCSGNSVAINNTVAANNLCACCGCSDNEWGCQEGINPGGGGPGNPWGNWGGRNRPPPGGGKGEGIGIPISNGVYCFVVQNCDDCNSLNEGGGGGGPGGTLRGVRFKCIKPENCVNNCGCSPGTEKYDTGDIGKMGKNITLNGSLQEQELSASDVKVRVEYIADFLDSADSNDPRGGASVFFNDIPVMNINQGPNSLPLACPGEAWNALKTLTVEEWAHIINASAVDGRIDVRIECNDLLAAPCIQGRTIVHVSYVSAANLGVEIDVETGDIGPLFAEEVLTAEFEDQKISTTPVAISLVAVADLSELDAEIKVFLNDVLVGEFKEEDAWRPIPDDPPPPACDSEGYIFFHEIPINLWNNTIIQGNSTFGDIAVRIEGNSRLSEEPCENSYTNLYLRYVSSTDDEIFPPCAAYCPDCGGPCNTGDPECCTINGGCDSYRCACLSRIQGICTAPATSALTDLGYRFSQKNKSLEDNLTIGYVYDIHGNVIRNDIFLFGYGTSFL